MKKMMLPILLLMVLGLVGLVHGAATFNAPTSSATIRGAVLFNVSVSATLQNVTNCTVTGSSAKTGDTITMTRLLLNSSWATGLNYTYTTTTSLLSTSQLK